MLYLVRRGLLKSPRILAMMKSSGDDPSTNLVCEQVRVDAWKAIIRRCPNQPWKHMKELYGKLSGTVLVAGSGASLRLCPEKVNVPSFAVNRSIRHLKADYWCVTDLRAYQLDKDHPNAKAAELVICCQVYDSLLGLPCYMVEMNGDPWRWKEDPPLYYNETTTGWAIHLAIRMGADKIVLIGQDKPGGGYFDEALTSEDRAVQQHYGVAERMLEMFKEKGKWMERPVEILDASPNGYLPVPKVELANAF